jgi:hypothetical protein
MAQASMQDADQTVGHDDSAAGLTQLQSLIAEHAEDPAEVMIGVETPHGLMLRALRAAGYTIYAVNPLAASRYRDRHAGTSPITQASGRTKVTRRRPSARPSSSIRQTSSDQSIPTRTIVSSCTTAL